MRTHWWSRAPLGAPTRCSGDKQKAKLPSPYFRRGLAAEHLEQRFLLSAVVELNAPSTNYMTSWTNSGAVAITGATASPTLVSGLNAPDGIAVSGANLWVVNNGSGTIGEYNAATGATVNARSSPGLGLGAPGAIAVSGANLWVANSGGTIGEYSATTGATVNASLVSGLSGPTAIAVSGANLFVTNFGSGTIGEYNATTGAPVNASLVSGLNAPDGIAVSGANLWVANQNGNNVGEYNATTGARSTPRSSQG